MTGLLGGPVYDHVYSIQVPARNVLVASLTGDPGTDFDLYLFDATATSVWKTDGLIAELTGPTSTESITWPSILTTTYYLDLHGFSEQEGQFRLSVSILPDLTPPQVSISIVGGTSAVNTPAVTLAIWATDDLSGVDVMAFSEDGVTWGPWQPLAFSVPWTLSSGDGQKTVWVRVRDRSGNVSAPASVSVLLDTTPPRVIEVDPLPNTSYSGLRPTFVVKFGEGIDPATWMDQGLLVRLGPSGTPIAGVYTYDAAGWRGLFQPSSDLVAGAIYSVSLGRIRDPAGNLVQPFPDWTLSPLAEGTLSIRVSSLTPAYGQAITVVGSARLPAPAPITIERHYAGSTEDWTPIVTAYPGPTGEITLTEVARQNADYRLHYPGGSLIAEGYSATTRVLVSARVALTGYTARKTNAGSAGRTVRLRAQVAPVTAGMLVDFRLYRRNASTRAYALVATYSRRTDASGRATLNWKLRSGTWQVRAATRATVQLTAGVSAVYRWVVP